MKKLGYWGKHDVCVRCGQYIYNISIWLDPNRSNKTERPKEELPQAYLDILEKREWSVCDYTDDGRVELEWYSPAGEDFIVCVKVENFPDEILDYSEAEAQRASTPAPGKTLPQLLEQLNAGECKGIKSATAYKIEEFARQQGYLE